MEDTVVEQRRWDAAIDGCAECGKKSVKLLRCSRCRACSYCGSSCQKSAYKRRHKMECKEIAREKESAGNSWSFMTHQVPRLPLQHPHAAQANTAGAQLAKEALEKGLSTCDVQPVNPNLAAWMQIQCCLSHEELCTVSEWLMGQEGKLKIRTLMLIGCSAAGQPTLEELLQIRVGRQSVARMRDTGLTFHRFMLDDRDEQMIFCPHSSNPRVNVASSVAFLMMMNNNTLAGDLNAVMDRFLFDDPQRPGQQPLSVDQVTAELRSAFDATGLANSKTGRIPINAIFHATSLRVLMQAGVPAQWHNVRHTPHSIWDENVR